MSENKPSMTAYNAGLLQGKAYRIFQAHLSTVLEPHGLSIPEWKILGQLYEKKELKPADLAQILNVDPPLITKLISELEAKKFVKKNSHSSDKRIVLVELTKKGSDVIPILENEVKTNIRKLFSGITPEEFQIYIKILATIVKQGHLLSITDSYIVD